MKTFSAYTNAGIVKFSVLCDSGCIFALRSAAMTVCDVNGWTIRRMEFC